MQCVSKLKNVLGDFYPLLIILVLFFFLSSLMNILLQNDEVASIILQPDTAISKILTY